MLADLVAELHYAFLLYLIVGGCLAWRWRMRQGEWLAAVAELTESTAGTGLEAAVELAGRQGLVLTPGQARQCGVTNRELRSLARLIIEVDGELKYDPFLDPNALLNEKRRQEALERAGYTVIRVSRRDVNDEPHEIVARVRHHLYPRS